MALAPLAVLAGDSPERGGRGEHWAAMDTDGDGTISKAEADAGAPRMAERFAEIDADSDGHVTKDEMHAARARFHEGMQARGEERFRSADTNGDGSIDRAEAQQGMPRAAEHFGELDADSNGLLTHEELRAGMHKHHGERAREGQQKPAQ
jgi:Ca2+-binding EF-hand superfamily protein